MDAFLTARWNAGTVRRSSTAITYAAGIGLACCAIGQHQLGTPFHCRHFVWGFCIFGFSGWLMCHCWPWRVCIGATHSSTLLSQAQESILRRLCRSKLPGCGDHIGASSSRAVRLCQTRAGPPLRRRRTRQLLERPALCRRGLQPQRHGHVFASWAACGLHLPRLQAEAPSQHWSYRSPVLRSSW